MVESQVPEQRTVQFVENNVNPVNIGSPVVAGTPNMNDRTVRNCYTYGGVGTLH